MSYCLISSTKLKSKSLRFILTIECRIMYIFLNIELHCKVTFLKFALWNYSDGKEVFHTQLIHFDLHIQWTFFLTKEYSKIIFVTLKKIHWGLWPFLFARQRLEYFQLIFMLVANFEDRKLITDLYFLSIMTLSQ